MKAFRLLALLLPAALAFAPRAAAAQVLPIPQAPDYAADRAAYNADVLRDFNSLMREIQTAWEAHDAAAAAKQYSAGATLVLPGGAPARGREAIRRETARYFGDGGTLLVSVSDFVASERLAYALGFYAYHPAGADDSAVATGTMTAVIIREGGHWRMHSQVFVPSPPPES